MDTWKNKKILYYVSQQIIFYQYENSLSDISICLYTDKYI